MEQLGTAAAAELANDYDRGHPRPRPFSYEPRRERGGAAGA